MIAMMIQPMVSSMIAEARMIWPRLRRMKFISRTTMATILTEEIDSAVPRNSEVISRLSGSGSSESGSSTPSATPQANGTAMPVSEMLIAARPTRCTSLRSVSMPVSSSSSRMPNCEIASIIAFWPWSGGNSACCSVGPERARAPTARAGGRRAACPSPPAGRSAAWPRRAAGRPASGRRSGRGRRLRTGRPPASAAAGGRPAGGEKQRRGCDQQAKVLRAKSSEIVRMNDDPAAPIPERSGCVPKMQLQTIRNKAISTLHVAH